MFVKTRLVVRNIYVPFIILKPAFKNPIYTRVYSLLSFTPVLSLLVSGKTYWPYFNQVFMVSAKHNDGVSDLKRYLLSRGRPGKWIFTRNMLTDQMPQEMAEMCVREKMLENIPNEIPYELGLEVVHWEIDSSDALNVAINILPGTSKYKHKRHLEALFVNSGRLLQFITRESLDEMKKIFDCDIKLKLIVVTQGRR